MAEGLELDHLSVRSFPTQTILWFCDAMKFSPYLAAAHPYLRESAALVDSFRDNLDTAIKQADQDRAMLLPSAKVHRIFLPM